ncbi:MAG TPA: serine protease, partial [Chitinophagaceae bacterium]|nr:serine protease [Chitinophagaceae bacterium]
MNEINIIETIERYINNEMNPEEKQAFEILRKSNAEIDQMVVEHTLLLQRMKRYGERNKLRTTLQKIHNTLVAQGKIENGQKKGKLVYLFHRYKRVAAIAAVIAGVTTIGVFALVNTISPKSDHSQLTSLSRDIQHLKEKQNVQGNEVNKLKTKFAKPNYPFKAGGSGFLIDRNGYLITNAHIIRNSTNIVVINNKGEQYNAVVAKVFPDKDLAILKIDDSSFKSMPNLPYGIRKTEADVAEPIYTLGYPRNEIVYSEGYLSAKTGFNGDTLSCQLGIAANRGNSGGPVFNHLGEIVGIISTKEMEAEGVAFAIQSKYIYSAIEDLKQDT